MMHSTGARVSDVLKSRVPKLATRHLLALAVLFFALAACSCPPTLEVTGFSPERGLPGTIIEIDGHGFNANPFDNTVTIGGSPTRIINGTTTKLRVVALRNLASGKINVSTGMMTSADSVNEFKRDGTTTRATPLQDSDSKLVTGQGFDVDRRYDMQAQGVNQKILVVLAKPSDVDPEALAPMGKTARQSVEERLNDPIASTNTYFTQASYGKTSAAFDLTPDWIPVSQIRDFYCWQQDDINRAQTAVNAAQADLDALNLDPSATAAQIAEAEAKVEEAKGKLRGAQNANNMLQEPDFLFAEALIGAKAAVPNFDTYSDYVVIVAGPFLRGQCCWVNTGFHAESTRLGLNFDIDFPSPKGLTYVAQQADWGRIAHELSHFFASGDLYSQGFADGSFVEGNASGFDLMGNHDNHPLYSGYNMERKLHYFNEAMNGNVAFLEWGSTPTRNDTFDIVAHAKTEDPAGDGTVHLLRLKVTDGLFYYVEVRQKPDPATDVAFDGNIALDPSNPAWQGGVIITKAVENNNQSNNNERQVMLVPPGRMFQVGDLFTDPARTIRINVEQKLADRPAKYRVRVQWGTLPAADPNGQFDLRITPWGAPPWETVDIWANSIKNDETSPAKIIFKNHEPGDETMPIGNGDPPWVGHDNTIFARVSNQGVVESAENVRVTFYVNTPPGVGDNGTWAPFDTVDIGKLAAGETRVIEASRKWRPAVGEHTCVKVEIEPQTGEVTFGNNQAQENFGEFETGAASPYEPVEFDFLAKNPYETPIVMDLIARNVPEEWFVAFDHGSVWLGPKQEKKVHVVIWTDRGAEWLQDDDNKKAPRKPLISIEGTADRWGDQVFSVGGVTAFVQAVRKVNLEINVRNKEPRRDEPIVVFGNVVPSAGVSPIAVHVTDPDGKLHVERTQTNNSGGFTLQMKYAPAKPGVHRLKGYVLGGSIAGEAESVEVPIGVP